MTVGLVNRHERLQALVRNPTPPLRLPLPVALDPHEDPGRDGGDDSDPAVDGDDSVEGTLEEGLQVSAGDVEDERRGAVRRGRAAEDAQVRVASEGNAASLSTGVVQRRDDVAQDEALVGEDKLDESKNRKK
jgi:hypothetical protein